MEIGAALPGSFSMHQAGWFGFGAVLLPSRSTWARGFFRSDRWTDNHINISLDINAIGAKSFSVGTANNVIWPTAFPVDTANNVIWPTAFPETFSVDTANNVMRPETFPVDTANNVI